MYLGIDVGTSAVKTVLVDGDGAVVADRSEPLALETPRPGWCEQDPEAWWQAVCASVQGLAGADGVDLGAVEAIGLSGQMHGAVCLDADMAVIRPAMLWNDTRSHAEADRLAAVDDVEEIVGVRPMPGFTATKVMWMRAHEPEAHARIAHVVTPKDHVRWRMTQALGVERSDAAGTCWLDQSAREWSQAMCAASDTDPDWLPPLLDGTDGAGRLSGAAARAMGLRAGVPVAAGAGDAAAGALGVGAVRPGEAFLSLGTSGQVFAVTHGYRAAPGTLVHSFAHALPDTWFQMACLLNGASPLAWWAGACGGASVGDLLAEAEGAPEGDVLFLPYLVGERTPLNDPYIRGAFYGLAQGVDRGTMTRAVLEGVAYSVCEARDAMARADTTLESLGAIGGGARSDLFLQTVADALEMPLHRYGGAETGAALGAARLARLSQGASLDEVATVPPVARTFEPDRAAGERHRERHRRFRTLYRALAPQAQELGGL